MRQIGPGVSVQVNVTGDDVLSGLLPTLRTLSAHLASNDTASLGTTDLKAIDAGFDNLTAKRGQVGAITNRVDAAGTRLDDTTTSRRPSSPRPRTPTFPRRSPTCPRSRPRFRPRCAVAPP